MGAGPHFSYTEEQKRHLLKTLYYRVAGNRMGLGFHTHQVYLIHMFLTPKVLCRDSCIFSSFLLPWMDVTVSILIFDYM